MQIYKWLSKYTLTELQDEDAWKLYIGEGEY